MLLAAVSSGDRSAGATLIERHHGSMQRCARSLVGQDAEDVVQQAWIDAIRGGSTYREAASVRAWLLTLTRNAAFRSKRRRAGQPREHVALEDVAIQAGWGADPETLVARHLDAARLDAALATLHPEAREILTLRDIEGLTAPEVAPILDITVAAVKSRLHRARLEFAAAVRQEFGHATRP